MQTLMPLLTTPGLLPMEGFWDTLMSPLYWAVSGLLVLAHYLFSPLFGTDSGITWTLAILLLTVIIRTALIPLFVRQIRSSRNMQVLQPKVRELQKKYAHDREKLGQETMKLYKDEGVNPMASCFPILLQMPIFFALFNVLNGAARGQARGTFLVDRPELVTSMANAKIFGSVRIADTFLPLSNGFGMIQVVALILILAMVATTFISQKQLMAKNMPPEAMTGPMAQQQKMMLYIFPVVFGIGGVSFPIGLLIYWTASNVWTMGQQFYVIRNSPTPGTPAYEAWEARMVAKGYDPTTVKPGQKPQKRRTVAAEETSEPTNAELAAENGTDDRPRIQRQQPRRQTRANRKK
ncbi:YidC/Oxa1 family membrane protein insertase [Propionibacteriaceae bacterium ES.041]|nr:YidC/Oxa1 family membrane protein insertase [Propionibacteriaceae bacterium ES.041]